MSHTFTKNHIHAVFSTKHRVKLISSDMQERLWHTTGICHGVDIVPVAIT